MPITAAMASTDGPRYKPIPAHFDTDSILVGLDSHASTCMSYDKSHFKDLRPYLGNQMCKGIGEAPIKGKGTLVLELVSDDGQPHTVSIENSLYIPALPKVLLSPQHFSDNCAWTCSEETALVMKGGRAWFWFGPEAEYLISTPNSKRTNVPEIFANRGCAKYEAFASHVDSEEGILELEQYDCCIPCTSAMNVETTGASTQLPSMGVPNQLPNVVSDDEESVLSEDEPEHLPNEERDNDIVDENIQDFMQFEDAAQQDIVEIEENEDVFASTDAGELLRYHYRFGHMSFARLKQMAKEGLIPKKLAKAKVPTCAACQFGKMTKRNWRTRRKGTKICQEN